MNVNSQRTFYFHAGANALGGTLQNPTRAILDTASASLAPVGGAQNMRLERKELAGALSFAAATAAVEGTGDETQGWRSTASATIEGLNILHTVTADRLVAQVSVLHSPDPHKPAQVSFNGTQFVNLRINGQLVEPIFDSRIFLADGDCEHNEEAETWAAAPTTFKSLLKVGKRQYHEQHEALKKLGPRFNMPRPEEELETKGTALCTLVRSCRTSARYPSTAHVISVADFGNIILGEMRIGYHSAQLTMLRVEMGCMGHGCVSAGSASSNGSLMP